MNAKTKFFGLIIALTVFLISCKGSYPTEAPGEATPVPSPTPAPGEATPVPSPTPAPGEATPVPSPTPGLTSDVVILVADNFQNLENTGIDLSQYGYKQSTNCMVVPDGQGKYGSGGLSMTILGEPHGTFVYSQVLAAALKDGFMQVSVQGRVASPPYTAKDFSGVSGLNTWIRRMDLLQIMDGENYRNLLVVAIDSEGLNLGALAVNIPAAIKLFNENEIGFEGMTLPKFNNFVVNMSFGIVPCDPAAFVDTSDYAKLFQEYQAKLAAGTVPSLEMLKENLGARGEWNDDTGFQSYLVSKVYGSGLGDWTYDDVFYPALKALAGRELPRVEYVAAAGNFGFEFPFAPAYWDFVTAVGSEGDVSRNSCANSNAKYSNCGEVKMDGVYFDKNNIIGTSFAAPRFSFKVAYNMILRSACPTGLNSWSDTGPWNNLSYACQP